MANSKLLINMKTPSTFKNTLTLHFIIVATLPMLLLGLFSVQYFENKHLETISRILNLHASNVSQEASELLFDTNHSLSMVAKTLNSGVFASDADIDQFLQIAVTESPHFESIYLLDENKRVTHLGLSPDFYGNREDFFGLDLSAHVAFAGRSQRHKPFWSDTFLSTTSASPSVTLGIPLDEKTLLGTVSLESLSNSLTERLRDLGLNADFALIDHHGVLIASSDVDLVYQRPNFRAHPEVRNALDFQIEVPSKFHEDHSLLESVRLVEQTNWVAYISMPVKEAMLGVAPLRFILITSLSLACLFGLALSLWLSRRVLKPVLSLRDAVGEVTKGNYDQILQPVRYVELEDLSKSFKRMLAAVEEREQALSANRARYRDLVYTIDGIVWELDLSDFRFTFISDQVETILGYSAEQWLEDKDFWQRHIYDDDRDWVISFCAVETAAKRDHDFEYRMLASDGRIIWLKDIVSVIFEDDTPVRLRGVMFDITKRKQNELILQETTDRLHLLINRMPIACILWNVDDKVEFWNPAAEAIFGFSSDEVLGLHPYDFMVPLEEKDYVEKTYKRVQKGYALAHTVNKNLTKDGRILSCEWNNTPLLSADGVSVGAISMVQDVSQRVLAEAALKESESRFRTVFQTNPDVVLITRLSDGVIVNVNEHCLIASGYSRDEIVGKTSLDIGFWEVDENRENFMKSLAKDGQVANLEVAFRLKNGRVRIGLISARTLTLNDELCALSVIRDVTDMKQAERRLMRSESRFRSLISVMGEGLLILGFNGEIVQCNQAAERILGRENDEILGKFLEELNLKIIHEDNSAFDHDEFPSTITMKTGEPVLNQILGFERRDGQIVWLQVNTHPLGLNRAGKPNAIVVSFADVSRLKRIETDLRKSEFHLQSMTMQFQGLLEAIPDQIMVIDRDMKVVWLNRHHDEGQIEHEQPSRISCNESPEVECGPASGNSSPLCYTCPVKKTFSSGHTEEAQIDLADGRTLSLRAFPVLDEQGDIVNVIEIVQDITEPLRQRAQTMRTGQLAALGELAAGVAHEINNPINGVINYAQLILNKAANESREQELSQRIIRESERIATIVRELLYFSRTESQQVDKVTVMDALSESLALAKNQLNKEGVDLKISLSESLPLIDSRSHQIQRLFLNLISNARYALKEKYPDGDPEKILLISGVEIEKEGQSFISVTFRDNGIGIPSEILGRVMNPFVTTKAAGVGTGLGLSISHEIVQKHGGTMTIESVEGVYTEVVVELPASG